MGYYLLSLRSDVMTDDGGNYSICDDSNNSECLIRC